MVILGLQLLVHLSCLLLELVQVPPEILLGNKRNLEVIEYCSLLLLSGSVLHVQLLKPLISVKVELGEPVINLLLNLV